MTRRAPAPGWTPLHPPRSSKTVAAYRHDATGWIIRHCGHPTANWPYYAVSPDGVMSLVVRHNGRGFRLLVEAFEAIEGVIAGTRAPVRVDSERYGYVWCVRETP